MKKITVNTGSHRSDVYTGLSWKESAGMIDAGNTVIITDENVFGLYGSEFPSCPVLIIKPGEKSKSLSTIEDLSQKLLSAGIDRKGFILGIGGGVVCDISGFLASIFLRGIRFGFVSTSLLSQVDASVGGKNGVNLNSVKNIIGTFTQPEFVICDQAMLATLPADEYLSGLAELVKTGAIMSRDLLKKISDNKERILSRDIRLMEELVHESVRLKAEVVSEDEKEKGRRMILNFGHTFGHAIEAITGMKHGLAVAAGMEIATKISVNEGLLEKDQADLLIMLLHELGMILPYEITNEKLGQVLRSDKKKSGDSISFVLLEATGRAVVKKMPFDKLMKYYINTR
ncbi:MAG: 3-dehydroquinate synthase [Bacteroidales bacterium]